VRHNVKLDTVVLFHADCADSAWETWGTGDPNPLRPAAEHRIPIARPGVIVDALVHCIDVASRREAVHEPDALHKLREDVGRYEALQGERSLTERDMLDWEFTLKELGRRKRLRVVEGEKEEEEEVETQIGEMLGKGVGVMGKDEMDVDRGE